MSAGYIYVLVNSSMPGLVKVGRTTKSPSDRADDLSGVTGVPTPFIVAYEEHFGDCEAAESFVHVKLAEKGVRVSQGREFFRATVSEVVKVIASINANVSKRVLEGNCDGLLTPDNDVFAEIQLGVDKSPQPQPWDDLMREADRHRHGRDDYIKDQAEAIRLYQDAARLGSPDAYEALGSMYYYGEGVQEDHGRALVSYKEGAKRGNYLCYWGMGILFTLTDHRDPDNARKCYAKFVSQGEADGWNHFLPSPYHIGYMYTALMGCVLSADLVRYCAPVFRRYIPELLAYCYKGLGATKRNVDDTTLRKRDELWGVVRLLQTLGLEPGSYRIFGVNRESGYKTELVVEAKDGDNVKGLGELHGMDVTAVERQG